MTAPSARELPPPHPAESGRCPLCGSSERRPSWLGATFYLEQRFDYWECGGCQSLYCHPMPDDRTVAHMYGPTYGTGCALDAGERSDEQVLQWLTRTPRGTLLDYGCGDGQLLAQARALGWGTLGLELDPARAAAAADRSGSEVSTSVSEVRRRAPVDALHLGDVIEHLTDLDQQMPEILSLLRPGGALLAQGPLEANGNLFTWALRGQRLLRRSPPAEFQPYHVLLATAEGQRTFFRRWGLTEQAFTLQEVAWPAPAHLSAADMRRPRALVMFGLRRASQLMSRLRPVAWGNRYFYAGSKGAAG